jgi:hypothetical protein
VVALAKARSTEKLALAFEKCLIRGHGDLVVGNPARPLSLKADNVLAVLSGSLLRLTGVADPALTSVAVHLDRTTTYLGGHLLQLTADSTTGNVIPVRVESAINCLFMAADEKVLVHLDGPDVSPDRMTEVLGWQGTHNAYTGFMDMLEQMPGNKMMGMRMPFNRDRWKQFARDGDAYNTVKLLNSLPLRRDDLPRVSAARFKVQNNFEQPYGADVDSLPKSGREIK